VGFVWRGLEEDWLSQLVGQRRLEGGRRRRKEGEEGGGGRRRKVKSHGELSGWCITFSVEYRLDADEKMGLLGSRRNSDNGVLYMVYCTYGVRSTEHREVHTYVWTYLYEDHTIIHFVTEL